MFLVISLEVVWLYSAKVELSFPKKEKLENDTHGSLPFLILFVEVVLIVLSFGSENKSTEIDLGDGL